MEYFFEIKKNESVLFFCESLKIKIGNYFVTIFLTNYHNYMNYIELAL